MRLWLTCLTETFNRHRYLIMTLSAQNKLSNTPRPALNTAQEPAKAVLRLTQRSARGARSADHVRIWHCGSSPRVLLDPPSWWILRGWEGLRVSQAKSSYAIRALEISDEHERAAVIFVRSKRRRRVKLLPDAEGRRASSVVRTMGSVGGGERRRLDVMKAFNHNTIIRREQSCA